MKARIILVSLLFTGAVVLTSFKNNPKEIQEKNTQIKIHEVNIENSNSLEEDEFIVLRSSLSAVSNLRENNI